MAHRIGLLTAGGDVAGLNVCLKAVVNGLDDLGYEVVGFRKGWEGLLNIDPASPSSQTDNTVLLGRTRVRDVDRQPGSFLHSSRVNPGRVSPGAAPHFLRPAHGGDGPLDLTPHIKQVVAALKLDALLVAGDNAALNYAARLSAEGVPLVGIPKSVHNDVAGSDYCLGFSTALARGVHFIHEVRAMAGSREEIAVVEVLGRTSGLTTLLIGALSGADRILVPEAPCDPDRLADLLAEDKRRNPNGYAILAMGEALSIPPALAGRYGGVFEEAAAVAAAAGGPAYAGVSAAEAVVVSGRRSAGAGAGGAGAVLTEILENLLGQRLLFQPLSYLLRSGEPDGQDLLGAMNFAALAVKLVGAGRTGRLVAYRRRENYVDLPIATVTQPGGNENVADFYDAGAYQARPGILWATRA